MSTTLILRLENAAGQGPYTGLPHHSAGRDALRMIHSGTTCPEPKDDGLGETRGGRFGFASPEQLLAWFPPNGLRRLLRQSDQRLSLYAVPTEKTAHGRSQSVFWDKSEPLLRCSMPCLARRFRLETVTEEAA